jgi:1-acyl-sn-glycerol-3-phosphate acyltransferase
MRSLPFNVAFWLISIVYTLLAAVSALRPGRGAVRAVIRRYVRRMVWAMRALAGIQIEVRGRERLPQGAFILAPKHASYGDGFSIYAQFDDLAFVTGDHLEPLPRGLEKDDFMARLEAAIEDRTAELVAAATGRPVTASVLGVPDSEA